MLKFRFFFFFNPRSNVFIGDICLYKGETFVVESHPLLTLWNPLLPDFALFAIKFVPEYTLDFCVISLGLLSPLI